MKYYLTAAIPYVNAKPHLGHAMEFVHGDVIARYHRVLGDETIAYILSPESMIQMQLRTEAAA
jgi:methionyl-tRNA synthetase